MTELSRVAVSLSALVDVDTAVQHAMGAAGKESALSAAARDLGSDRRFSGVPSTAADLRAGYDLGDPVILNLRPEGLWILAEDGRRRSGEIRPNTRRRRGRTANRQPRGLPAVGSGGRFVKVGRYRPSRGLNTISDAIDDMSDAIPAAIGAAIDAKARQL